MTQLYEILDEPELDAPVLIMALKGWIDAGLGADGAVETIIDLVDRRTIARFDADQLLDWRARRPVMRLEDGINARVSWEDTEVSSARDQSGNDVLFLFGNEPDHQWLSFSEQVVDVAERFGARLIVGLGAYPTPVPHTRPPLLAASASTAELTQGLIRNSVEVPTGVQGMIERRAALRGVPAVGLWAQVPHYVAAMPYPAASLALLEATNRIAGLDLPLGELAARAETSRGRIDELISQNPEHLAMLHQLEQQADESATTEMASASGEELVAELERFLRNQGS